MTNHDSNSTMRTLSEGLRAFQASIEEAGPAIRARLAQVARELNASIEKAKVERNRRQ